MAYRVNRFRRGVNGFGARLIERCPPPWLVNRENIAYPARVNRILHIDMDAFFAAIEERDQPSLQGKPVVIGSPPDRRGVVSTANYEARKFGIHSAMPSRTAGKLCPQAIFLPVRMSRYVQVSHQFMRLLDSFSPVVEQISIDEAFLDASGALKAWGTARRLGEAIQERIHRDLGLTASVGVARNKFLAKLASDLQKPNKLTECPHTDDAVQAFLAPLPIRKLWGVGSTMEKKLRGYGLETIGDLQRCDQRHLNAWLGPVLAEHLRELAAGRDDRPVTTERETKSISAENTFDEDLHDPDLLRSCLLGLMEQVGFRLRKAGLFCRTIHIKLRYGDFQTVTRQVGLDHPTCTDRILIQEGMKLFQGLPSDQRAIRLIGFGVSGLVDSQQDLQQLDLFSGGDPAPKEALLDRAADSVRTHYGRDAIQRAGRLAKGQGH